MGLFGDSENQQLQTPGSNQGAYRGSSGGPCRIRNPECLNSGSRVVADLEAQCMCVDDNCFEISIGKYGPKMTRNGTGIIGSAPGSRYTTRPGPGTTSWDNDALRMGIPQNDSGAGVSNITAGGKWIHKTGRDANGRCVEPTQYTTLGCIGVPCDQWPNMKAARGSTFTVCGGAATDQEIVSRYGCPGSLRGCSPQRRLSTMNFCSLYRMRQEARGEPAGQCGVSPTNYPNFERGSEDRPTRPRARPQRTDGSGVVR